MNFNKDQGKLGSYKWWDATVDEPAFVQLEHKAPWLRNSVEKTQRTDRWASVQWKAHRFGNQMGMQSNPGYVTYLCDLSPSVPSVKYGQCIYTQSYYRDYIK